MMASIGGYYHIWQRSVFSESFLVIIIIIIVTTRIIVQYHPGPNFQKILSQTYDEILFKITLRHSRVTLTIWRNWSKYFTIILS